MSAVTAQTLLKKFLPLLIVIALAIPGVHQLFQPGFFSSHDGEGHVIRMEEFYNSFRDGQIPVRWSKRLYYGYGYPFFNFNYPSVYYFGVPFMLVGFSATDAMKAELILTFITSGAFMYLYLRRKIPPAYAVFGSLLYMYAPYRLVNIFVRGSVAESAAFIFPPLLLWIAENIAAKKPKSIWWGALIIGTLGISHNISALILFGFFFGYVAILSLHHRSLMPLLRGGLTFMLGLMLAAFFFVPALAEKKLTFLDSTIAKDYPTHFISLVKLVASGWSYGDNLSLNVGWIHLGLMIVAVVVFLLTRRAWRKNFAANTALFVFCMIALVGAIFLALPISRPLWDHLPLLPFVQFPWRFLMITVPALSIGATLGLFALVTHLKLSKKFVGVIMVVLIGGVLFISKFEWKINQQIIVQEVPGDALLGSTTWADEQATQWFLPKPTAIPSQKIEIADPKSTFNVTRWKTGEHVYSLSASKKTQAVENTMYYPGWQVFVDGKEVAVNYQDAKFPGRIVYNLEKGEHGVVTRLTETPLRKGMDAVSFVTFAGLMFMLVQPGKAMNATAVVKSKRKTKKRR